MYIKHDAYTYISKGPPSSTDIVGFISTTDIQVRIATEKVRLATDTSSLSNTNIHVGLLRNTKIA